MLDFWIRPRNSRLEHETASDVAAMNVKIATFIECEILGADVAVGGEPIGRVLERGGGGS